MLAHALTHFYVILVLGLFSSTASQWVTHALVGA